MLENLPDYANNGLQIIALCLIVTRIARDLDGSRRTVSLLYLAYAAVVIMVADLYWIAYLLLKRESLYAFSAVDIGFAGMALLLPLSLHTAFPQDEREGYGSFAISIAFTLGNAALWLLWGGQWLKNTLGAMPFWYLAHSSVRFLRRTHALGRRDWLALGCGFVAIIFMNIAAFWDLWHRWSLFDFAGSLLWIVGAVLLLVRTLGHMRDRSSALTASASALAGVTWALCTEFDSFEPFYSIGGLFVTAFLLCLHRSLTEAVTDA